ncbi:MAG: hypothetical protein LBC41_09465, partial [Clostridiales bacterium]|nr:hypothetical protein [Clostridiales bacterium]
MGSGDEKSNKYEFCEKYDFGKIKGKSKTYSNDISREYEKSKSKIKSKSAAKIKTAAKTCFALAFTLALITGCWDKVELENRGFAVSFGIDEKDGKYLVTVSMPSVSSLKEGPSDSAKDVRSEESDTVSGAIRAIDDSLSQRLDFGQAKLLLFGQELLDNEDMFRQAIDACERNGELNREIYVLAADGGARKVLEQKLD